MGLGPEAGRRQTVKHPGRPLCVPKTSLPNVVMMKPAKDHV